MRFDTRTAVMVIGLGLAAGPPARAGDPAPTPADQAAEVAYMEFVGDHHLMGTLMAELCHNKARSRVLERLCERIDEAQTREIGLIERWLSDWYGEEHYSPELTDEDADDLARLGRLGGKEFDVAISRMFIDHHRQIVERSRAALPTLYHKKLVRLAEDIIRTQSREIREFEAIIRSYGETP